MTALVLCGGGSRGAVEVGLYRAIAELGIPIGLIVGTSVGAINGAAIAAGVPPATLERLWKSLRARDLVRLNRQLFWKFVWADSLYDHRPLRRFLDRCLPVRRFEELRIPLVITGTDFETGQPIYWREGDLIEAVMASTAMPGLFPPQLLRGVQVVDGGITDNVPIEVAVAEGADTVIFMLCACCDQTARPSWIYRITTNAAYGKLRARSALTLPLAEAFDDLHESERGVGTPRDWSAHCEDPAVQAELRAVIERAIGELPTEYRTAVILHDIEGLANTEVAEILGVSLPAVKSRVHRARLAFRARLARYFEAQGRS